MYNSLKSWMNVPFQIKPFIKRSGTGTKQYGETIDAMCLPEGDAKTVVDGNGVEVVSATQLYVDGALEIKDTDDVIFEGKTLPIRRINTFYRSGVPDIKVVYL